MSLIAEAGQACGAERGLWQGAEVGLECRVESQPGLEHIELGSDTIMPLGCADFAKCLDQDHVVSSAG